MNRQILSMETVGKLAEHKRLKPENDELKAHVIELREELSNFSTQHKCGCGHTACNRCGDDECAEAVLDRTPAQSLAELQAKAVENIKFTEDDAIYILKSQSETHNEYDIKLVMDELRPLHDRLADRATHIRQQAKE